MHFSMGCTIPPMAPAPLEFFPIRWLWPADRQCVAVPPLGDHL